MKTAAQFLTEYAAYHRDRRNIAIHGIGIPLIVLALVILASRAAVHAGSVEITLADVLLAILVVFYLLLDPVLAIAFAIAGVLMVVAGNAIAAEPIGIWLGTGIGTFVFGWILQFIGHAWEGKKPAFVDDIMGLAIGPLFVTAEAFFAVGLKRELNEKIEAGAGPVYVRTTAAKA